MLADPSDAAGAGRPSDMAPHISVCILAGHGADMLSACLMSLADQHQPPAFELVVGLQSEGTTEIVRRHFPGARICWPGSGTPGWRRNALVDLAAGEILLFLDDDVTVSPDLLHTLSTVAAEHPETSVFGGPNVTPRTSSAFQVVQGAVLSSLVGAGPVSRRYGARRAGRADERWFTLCNLAVRRDAMVPFLRGLTCAEENAMLAALHARGRTMRYEPRLKVFHHRRPTLASFARQMFKYGLGRGQLIIRRPRDSRLAFLLPSLLVLYALVVTADSAVGPFSLVLLAPLALYGLLIVTGSAWISFTLRCPVPLPVAFPIAVLLTLTVHLLYGAGVLTGLAAPGAHWRQERRSAASWADTGNGATDTWSQNSTEPPRA